MQLVLPDLDMDPRMVDTRPDNVASWLDRLPYTNLLDCGQQLLEALDAMGRTSMDAALRHKLLQLYLGTLDRYYPALEAEIQQVDLVSTPRSRQLASLGISLFNSVFIAFKRTLTERLAKRGLLERDQPRIELLVSSMMAARQLLNICIQTYTPPPAGFWLDCHKLHEFAISRGWQDHHLPADDTVAVIYRQILLLGLTSTNRLSLAEITMARRLAIDLSHQTQLIPLESLQYAELQGYLVDINRDEPPRFLSIKPDTLGPGFLVFDLSSARTVLQHSVEQLSKAQNTANQAQLQDELNLLVSLADEWHQPKRRRHKRLPTQEVVNVTASVPSIWYQANGMSWILPGHEDVSLSASTRTPSLPSQFVVLNQSATGYLLRGQPHGQNLRAGEVILLGNPNKPENSQLCLICWVSLLPDGMDIECGVETVGMMPQPAMAIPTITHPTDVPQCALIIPAIPALGKPARLLMQGRPYSRLREFRLWSGKNEQLIRVPRLDQQSPCFQLMEFRDSDHF